jgi:uncharacterized MnhB-related membrane protein
MVLNLARESEMKKLICILLLGMALVMVGCQEDPKDAVIFRGVLESIEVKTTSWNSTDIVILRFKDGPAIIQAISAHAWFIGKEYVVTDGMYGIHVRKPTGGD